MAPFLIGITVLAIGAVFIALYIVCVSVEWHRRFKQAIADHFTRQATVTEAAPLFPTPTQRASAKHATPTDDGWTR